MEFYGLAVETLSSPHLHLDVLKSAGLRIVRLSLNGNPENLLAETPEVHWTTQFGEYRLFGGHRLSIAPEGPLSYVPEGSEIVITPMNGGIKVEQAAEPPLRMRKSMTIKMCNDRPAVTIEHAVENISELPVQSAAWAVTQLVSGGTAILPLGEYAQSQNRLLPDRLIAAWPYTSLHDTRLRIEDDLILVDGCPKDEPLKIGIMNHQGWLAYLQQGTLFVKRFDPQASQVHAHYGCNAEVYSNGQYVELETTGPLVTLASGETVLHRETWEVIGDLKPAATLDAIRSLVRTHILV